MSLPQNLTPDPSESTTPPAADPAPAAETTVTETPAVTEPVTTEPAATVDPASTEPAVEEPAPVDDPTTAVDESSSDAELRAWAKDNGIEDVPAVGRLSATWREQILAAMTAALAADPKAEASADATPTDSSTSETTTEEPTAEEEAPAEKPLTGPGSDQPEFAHGGNDYRSVFQAPDTWMTSQAYTA